MLHGNYTQEGRIESLIRWREDAPNRKTRGRQDHTSEWYWSLPGYQFRPSMPLFSPAFLALSPFRFLPLRLIILSIVFARSSDSLRMGHYIRVKAKDPFQSFPGFIFPYFDLTSFFPCLPSIRLQWKPTRTEKEKKNEGLVHLASLTFPSPFSLQGEWCRDLQKR